jgi:hypothetical protein
VSFDKVFFYNRAHVAGRNTVEVEHIGDGNSYGLVVWHKPQMKNPAPQAGPGRKTYAITGTSRT